MHLYLAGPDSIMSISTIFTLFVHGPFATSNHIHLAVDLIMSDGIKFEFSSRTEYDDQTRVLSQS